MKINAHGIAAKPITLRPLDTQDVLRAAMETKPPKDWDVLKPKPKAKKPKKK